jgi:uncharacterized protein (DUF4415 family)
VEDVDQAAFSKGKRGAVISSKGKTRITIYLDDEVLDRFRLTADRSGKGYQTLINDALRAHHGVTEKPVTAGQVREIVREELASHTVS